MDRDDFSKLLMNDERDPDVETFAIRALAVLLVFSYNPGMIASNPQKVEEAIQKLAARTPTNLLAVSSMAIMQGVQDLDAMNQMGVELDEFGQPIIPDFPPEA